MVAELITFSSKEELPKESIGDKLKNIWKKFISLDKNLKIIIVSFALIAVATPSITATYLTFYNNASTGSQNSYYIDNVNGNDSNTGLSEDASWKTVSKVNSANFLPGDQILFKSGGVWPEKLIIKSSGIPGSPITFKSYSSGNKPILNGIHMLYQSYVNIDGLESDVVDSEALNIGGSHDILVTNSLFDGKGVKDKAFGSSVVWVWETPTTMSNPTMSYNIIFRNVVVRNGGNAKDRPHYGNGLNFRGVHDVLVENCEIYNNVESNTQAYTASTSSTWNYNVIWRNNIIYNNLPFDENYETGINFGWHTRNSIAEKNLIYNIRIPIQVDSITNDNIIRNNVIINGKDALIRVLANRWGSNNKTQILNNTLISDNGYLQGITLFSNNGNSGTGHVIKNNLSYSTTPSFSHIYHNSSNASLMDFSSDYNSFYTKGGTPAFKYKNISYNNLNSYKNASAQDSNSISVDPLLADQKGHLGPQSPVINAGVKLNEVVDDFQNTSRPQGGVYDIGAYEHSSPIVPISITISPTPGQAVITPAPTVSDRNRTTTACSQKYSAGQCQFISIGLPCRGGYVSNLCPGPSNYKCCRSGWQRNPPKGKEDCQTKYPKGQCQKTSARCTGGYVSGLCPGPSNIKCCISGGAYL